MIHGATPSACAVRRILSSMSVTFRQNVTEYPLACSHRFMTSKQTAERRWPMCGGACTVAPHRYTDTSPGLSGVNSRTERDAVSWNCKVTVYRL